MTARRLDRTTCEETFRRLDDYLDRRLSPEETKLIEEHLHLCDACSREFVFEASVIEAVREKLRRVTAPPDLIARISEQIRGEQDGG
jgi:anti-sigma factor (TIGR02949 family)